MIIPSYFWILFPFSLFSLSIYSWTFEKPQVKKLHILHWLLSLSSGLFLYLLFAFGKWFIEISDIPLMNQLQALYELVKPSDLLHYIWLFIVVIPGEEWFWRGFIVERVSKKTTMYKAAFSVRFYTEEHIL
ncbi:hypothetical protein [Halalkalibacter okhensis]|uniref:hypothetical protein n=1 Tax=Halalkalibacter okhensis TaxID=333138 RepID=UPI001F41AAD5|nr:hypothetical protein [Halalkalibacter okhensis]